MYEGMAKLKLYEDSSCLNELPRAFNGNYIFTTSIPTGSSAINYNRNIYIKNVGTHTAYRVNLSKISGDKEVALTIPKTEMFPKSIMTCKAQINFLKGEKYSGAIQLKLDYDNLP